jgi:hypothetical protein
LPFTEGITMGWSVRIAGLCCLLFLVPQACRADFLGRSGLKRDGLSLHVTQAGWEAQFEVAGSQNLGLDENSTLTIRMMIATLDPATTVYPAHDVSLASRSGFAWTYPGDVQALVGFGAGLSTDGTQSLDGLTPGVFPAVDVSNLPPLR